MKTRKGVALYKTAKRFIPGGTQLLSKRPEMFLPEEWPSYYSKCRGIEVWDIDGNRYLDFTIAGVGACTLGYADRDVDAAVKEAIRRGNMCTLNAPEEVELAELLCKIHPWADMVRYARGGGEAMAIAVRIARAYTGKEKILFCGYHGWHDWYLSANLAEVSTLDGQLLPGLEPVGIPRGLLGTATPFYYNDTESFKKLIDRYGNDIAAVVMEPVRNVWPTSDFIAVIRQVTADKKIPLVFDEVTSGLRMTSGGIHLKFGIDPDIAVFAKALGNGYPMAAIIGRSAIMSTAQRTFISSTYWTDRIGPSAAIATIKKHKKMRVGEHLVKVGTMVQDGWRKLGAKHDLPIHVSGIPPLSHWNIDVPDSGLVHTAIVKKMLEKGFLTSSAFYATYCHSADDVKKYMDALDEVLDDVSRNIKGNTLTKMYSGPIAHSGFKRLT